MASIFDDWFQDSSSSSNPSAQKKIENEIFIACSRNNLKRVNELLSQAAEGSIDLKYPVNGFTALHTASKKGYNDIALRLLRYDKDSINARTSDGRDALMIAAYEGHLEVIKTLISSNKEGLKASDDSGNTALHYAAWGGHLPCVQGLVEAGAAPGVRNKDGMLPLQYAAAGNHTEIVRLLLQSSEAEINDDSVLGLNALHRAAQYGSLSIVQLLLSLSSANPPNSNLFYTLAQCSANGSNPLHYAAQHGHNDLVGFMLSNADQEVLNKQNEYGLTPLHYSCIGGYFSIAKSLLDAGARVDLSNENGESALHLSAASGRHDLCRLLVSDFDVDVFTKDREGKSAIDKAVAAGYKELAHVLAVEACIQHAAKEIEVARDRSDE